MGIFVKLPCVVNDHVIDIRHVTDRTIDTHFTVPAVLIKQRIFGPDNGKTNFFASVVTADNKLCRHTHVFASQLQHLALTVILTQFQGHHIERFLHHLLRVSQLSRNTFYDQTDLLSNLFCQDSKMKLSDKNYTEVEPKCRNICFAMISNLFIYVSV